MVKSAGVYVGGSFRETRLEQLKRLVLINRDYREDLNEVGQWLLDRSMFTIYCDLHDLGDEQDAKNVLSGVPEELTRNPGQSAYGGRLA